MGFNWPNGMKEVPLLKEIVDGDKAIFIDGSCMENVQSIILCTGYKHSFPFLSNNLKKKTKMYYIQIYLKVLYGQIIQIYFI